SLEEQRKILFSCFSEKPTYPELSLKLDKIEELLKEEEDPVKLSKRVDALFVFILMWHRDQNARALSVPKEKLFFPQEPTCPPVSLAKVENAVEKGRFAYMRNMKLSHCLKAVL